MRGQVKVFLTLYAWVTVVSSASQGFSHDHQSKTWQCSPRFLFVIPPRAAADPISQNMTKTKFITLIATAAVGLSLSACATIFTKGSQEVTFKGIPGTTVTDTKKNTVIAEVGQNGFATAHLKKQLSGIDIKASKEGYDSRDLHMGTKIQGWFWGNIVLGGLPGMAIDVATGKMKKFKDTFVDVTLMPSATPAYTEIPNQSQNIEVVTRENPGTTDMEKAILRWYFDSDPRGARIFYRVISSVPNEVKNTNETYLTTTPLEETRSFNIQGLTYNNSRDVTIEIKVSKRGYEDQVKRFNVRQAIDQQEISGFFEMVPKETEE